MKQTILICIAVVFSSCSVIKSLKKDKTKIETQAEEKHVKESEKLTKTTTTESLDSAITILGSEIADKVNIKGLETGRIWTLEDADQKVTLSKDTAGNVSVKATVKPKTIPIKINKKIEQEIKETIKEKSDSTGTSKTKDKSQAKDVKRTGIPWWWFIILLLIAVGYYLYRKYKP